MFRHFLFFLCLSLSAALAVQAEGWQSRTYDNGSLMFGSAHMADPESGLSFGCTAPSPQGQPLIETGSHESHRNGPYQITVSFYDRLFDWALPYRQENVVLWAGRKGYRLPPVELNELQGTAVYLSMTDKLVAALLTAPSLVLDTGQGKRHSYSVQGLAPALKTALGYCVGRWAAMGHPVPAGLGPLVAGAAPAPAPAPTAPPRFIADMVARNCGSAGYVLDHEKALGQADFDGDSAPDYIFSGYGVRCYAGPNPFCGASKCSLGVFLSSRGYASVDGWIGGGFAIGRTDGGRAGLYRFGDTSRPLETWNGTAFMPAQ